MNKSIDATNLELNSKIKIISKGVVIAIATSMILLIFFSALLTYTSISERTSTPVIIIITAISILFSTQLSTRKIKKDGIINGGIIGGIYIVLLYIISSIVTGTFSLGINAIIMIISSVLAGMAGGIIGVNSK